MAAIKFRPHHFLCAAGFQGEGYSDVFADNLASIVASLRSARGDAIAIEVVAQTDSICTPCPHKRDKLCAEQHKIEQLDNAHAKALSVQPGEVLSWGEAKKRIVKNISVETFHAICAPCSWKDLGFCETALKKLSEPVTSEQNAKSSVSPKRQK